MKLCFVRVARFIIVMSLVTMFQNTISAKAQLVHVVHMDGISKGTVYEANFGGQDRRVTMVGEVFDMTWESLELARGIEPPTCGLQISGTGLLKSLKIWAIPPSFNQTANFVVV